MKKLLALIFIALIVQLPSVASASSTQGDEAVVLVEKAFDYWRGVSSIARFSMTIERPDFTRSMVMKGWTKGRQEALFFVEKPAKDSGNGTLKVGRKMWTYNPKINRVIKLPPSMMSQSWMGSDFSNDDLAKSDSLLDDYDHKLVQKETRGEHQVFTIESIAREDAPVVWGKQILVIRDDAILLKQTFFDEDMEPVKEMVAENIVMMGDRLFPKLWTMRRVDEENRATRMEYLELAFDVEIADRLFTLGALKNRGR